MKTRKMAKITRKPKEVVRKKGKMNETISFVIKGKLTPLQPIEKAKFKRQRKKIDQKMPKTKKEDVTKDVTKEDTVKATKQKTTPEKAKKPQGRKPKTPIAKKPIELPKKPKVVKPRIKKPAQIDEKKSETPARKPKKAVPIKIVQKVQGTKPPKKPIVTPKPKPQTKEIKKAPAKKPIKEKPELPKIKPEPIDEPPVPIAEDKPPSPQIEIKEEKPEVKPDVKPIKKEPPETKTEVKKPQKPIPKKRVLETTKEKVAKRKAEQRRKMKLFTLWSGPKRHRVASLNALAKVHCLYENESRANIIDNPPPIKREPVEKPKKQKIEKEEVESDPPPARNLRTAPGLRGAGKHWDMHDTTSSSSSDDTSYESAPEIQEEKKEPPKKPEEKKPPVKRRKRNEVVMDLKDMVVRKRMASLNASAILAASYSLEKNSSRSPKNSSDSDSDSDSFSDEFERKPEDVKTDDKVIEVRASPNKKVAVIVNQDTDVTITGVYVNSTTRSTHHEGYCSIAGMQYRISATSHTQTAATAVATETLLQSTSSSSQENSNGESTPSKSYTPLDALTNMQPPSGAPTQHGVPMGHHHIAPHISPQLSPLPRRPGCSSAFSAPPGHYPPAHHHPPPIHGEQGYIHGYYQPAGPLITVPPHGHSQQTLGKTAPLSEASPSISPPPSQPPPAPSSAGDSSDNDVIITSVMTKDTSPQQQAPYRPVLSQYPPPAHSYPYAYPSHYYHAPPPLHPASYSHHELCYPSSTAYLHKGYPYRRYLAPPTSNPYFPANPPDLYAPPPQSQQSSSQQSQQVVSASQATAAGGSGGSYQPLPSGPPTHLESYPQTQPPPTLVDGYPPPPPHYYPGYVAPPPPCYSHSPTRPLPYGAYQGCPCPMTSCSKNVHTGPLIGNKRSDISQLTKDALPPPIVLQLPKEPVSATGPPSPARGSAGMPAPTSPAVAGTYQAPPTPKRETPEPMDLKNPEKRRKARIGKAVVRDNLHQQTNTMLLMCQEPQPTFLDTVKREVESPKEDQKKIEAIPVVPVEEIKPPQEETKEPVEVQPEPSLKVEEEPKSEKLDDDLQPCVATVAENVKVKNMKRRLSITKVEDTPLTKKIKAEKINGSYKDLIKKNATIQIHNGKKKLLSTSSDTLEDETSPQVRVKKPTTKRKRSPSKEEAKKIKTTKPLTTNNNTQIITIPKEKDQTFLDTDLIENKEPKRKKSNTRLKTIKSNVDKTIDSVVNEARTGTKVLSEDKARTVSEKVGKVKCDVGKEVVKKVAKVVQKVVKPVVEVKKVPAAAKRKTKTKSIDAIVPAPIVKPRKSLVLPRWSNGWTWVGEPFDGKIFLNSDEANVIRKCYPAMRHEEGDTIEPRDCVLLKAGQRKNDLPFVAKIAALWENPEDGEMMMSLLWYYRPEHTEQGRQPIDEPDEVFASRHKDSNSVACIEDKCFVLTFHEYCRYRKNMKRLELGLEDETLRIPMNDAYPRTSRQPPANVVTSPDMVFFCRRVYDFRQKRIVKNPS